MKILRKISLGLLLLTGMGLSIQAQAIRNAGERASDQKQIQRGQATIARDNAELKQFRADRTALATAVSNRNVARARKLQAELVGSMEREIAQGEAKIRQSQGEVKGSKAEVRSERRDLRGSRASARPVQAVDDRRDKRDDRQDLRDDKSDRAEQVARNNRQQAILADFRAIRVNGAGDLAAIQGKSQLLDEFEQTMVRDMGENVEELREDKGELREDRRETREDRRQR